MLASPLQACPGSVHALVMSNSPLVPLGEAGGACAVRLASLQLLGCSMSLSGMLYTFL